ncbi:MAG: 50S ribosomal protein L19 [Patescibacteria group bacterium]
MTTLHSGVVTSPVQMEDRKNLGLKAGDTVKVHQRIIDKGKTRIQIFEGLVLARKHGDEAGATFTVRKMSSGIGVEKIYPLYSPLIEQIEIVKRAKVRRAKLYYIREKVAREIKRQMRRMSLVSMSTESETDATARIDAEAKVIEEAAAAAEAEAIKVAEAETASQTPEVVEVVEEVAVETPAETSAPEAEVVAEATPETPAEEEKKDVA